MSVNVTLTTGELGAAAAASASPDAFDEKLRWIHHAAGHRLPEIELQCHCPFVTVTPDRDAIAVKMAPAFGLTPAEALDVPLALLGTVDELCDTVERRRARYGFTYWIVPDDAMEAFAPVVARLAGR